VISQEEFSKFMSQWKLNNMDVMQSCEYIYSLVFDDPNFKFEFSAYPFYRDDNIIGIEIRCDTYVRPQENYKGKTQRYYFQDRYIKTQFSESELMYLCSDSLSHLMFNYAQIVIRQRGEMANAADLKSAD
jgi:hypothetical protein